MTTQYTVEDFLDYLEKSKSKNTYKSYKRSIALFSEYFDKTPNEVLKLRRQDWKSDDLHQKRRFAREIEKFHRWMINKGYTINSARANTIGVLQLFRYFEMPLTTLSDEIKRTTVTTKDFVPRVEQYRLMFKVADDLRSRLIISMGIDLGWRIGDFAKLRKDILPDLEQDAPILFELITEKENVIAKSFLSQETVDLLKVYLATVKDNPNPYLFPSNKEGYFDPESINRILRKLAAKANVMIPKTKRLRFHAFRKRFLSECANLRVDVNTAKILVGKSVSKDMLTYLSEVEHRESFIRVHQRLRLTETPMRKRRESSTELENRLELLETKLTIIGSLAPDLMKRVNALVEKSD
ncbi:tyrosine-type recombinase/integrase, partial [Candidatus Bathyarchaeota archaeon]|nr:tyrosine-type recombinase/integrase [Candidatus Bathyarchaeota archaeon]